MIELRKVTMKNFNEIIELPQSEEDKKMVAPNIYSLAEAYADQESVARGIYSNEDLVGFIMYDYNEEEHRGYITRLMITTKEQGKGYGAKALKIAVSDLLKTEGLETIQISYAKNNEKARCSYKKVGFVETNKFVGDEIIALIYNK